MSEIDEIVTQNALRNVDELPSLSVQDYIQRATTDNTRKAYQQDIRHFESWGGKLPTDTATVIRYCHAHAESHNPRTLQRRLVALKQFHIYQGFADPTSHPSIRKALRGIQNTHGKPKRKAQALQLEQLKTVIDFLSSRDDLISTRDCALISIGFFGALRGSELVNLQHSHIDMSEQGLTITIERSKTDPTGEGQHVALPQLNNDYCPITLLERWLSISCLSSGYLFRSINRWDQISTKPLTVRGLNKIIARIADQCELPNADRYSSHSLRRGLATCASAAGASFKSIMQQGRWKHQGTVLEYIEEGQRFTDNPVHSLFQEPSNDRTERDTV